MDKKSTHIKIYDQNKLINSIKVNSNNTKTLIKDIVISSIEEGYNYKCRFEPRF